MKAYMSEDKEIKGLQASNELIRWLQLLVLPTWFRILLMGLVLLVLIGAAMITVVGIIRSEKDQITGGITLLTIGLPIMLIVVALVFGQQSDKKLVKATQKLLSIEVPTATLENLAATMQAEIEQEIQGCRCNYRLKFNNPDNQQPQELQFTLEINVKKANLAFWMKDNLASNINKLFDSNNQIDRDSAVYAYKHVIIGAESEGYIRNPEPAQDISRGQNGGLLFIRQLESDFLLKPILRLYFCQDLAFFVRGILEATLSNDGNPPNTLQSKSNEQ